MSWQTPWGNTLAATAVYAPCTPQDRAAFFLDEYEVALSSGTQQGQIVGGDFNCVMRAADVLPAAQQQPAASSRMVGGEELRTVNFVNRLQDAWLLQHPHVLQPTHYTQHASSTDSTGQQVQGDVSGGRIDYVFLSDDLIDAGWLQRTLQHRVFPSDHRPVLAYLQPPGTPESGKGRWRFPNHLLGVETFREQYRSQLLDGIAALGQRSSAPGPSRGVGADQAARQNALPAAGAAAEAGTEPGAGTPPAQHSSSAQGESRRGGTHRGCSMCRMQRRPLTAFEDAQLDAGSSSNRAGVGGLCGAAHLLVSSAGQGGCRASSYS